MKRSHCQECDSNLIYIRECKCDCHEACLIMKYNEQIQKKIDWVSSQIRETKISLHRQYKELKSVIKEQEEFGEKK